MKKHSNPSARDNITSDDGTARQLDLAKTNNTTRARGAPELKLLDLPEEVFESIFLRAVDARNGEVPFTQWYLGGVCRRFQRVLYNYVQKVSLANVFEHDKLLSIGGEKFVRAPANVLAGPLLRCANLAHLDITSCDNLIDAQLIRFLRGIRTPLRSFTAVICMRQTDACVQALAHTCSNSLEEINLSGCDRYRHTANQRRPRPRPHYRPCRALSDASLYNLVSQCTTTLKKISLSSAAGITDSGLAELANLPNLNVVLLRRLTEITDHGITALANGKGKIHTFHLLSVGAVTDAGFISIAYGKATKATLKSIAISFNYNITDRSVGALLENAPLETLKCDHCALLSESWTTELQRRSYDTLHTVSLRGVSLDISSRGIRNLASVTRLREINLGFVASITASVLNQLKRSAPYLETLVLEACSKVDNVAAQTLSDFPSVVSLDVSWCSKLSESGLLSIVRGTTGKRLEYFCLGPVNGGCTRRRRALLYELGATCSNLRTLVLCGEVDDESLEWLRSNSPAEVEYADVVFRSSKRRTSTASNSSGMSE